MWKKYDVYKTQDPKELCNNARREFNLPRNEKTVQNDYNSYMLMKKYKQPEDKNRMTNIENYKKYQKNALPKKQQYSSNRYPQEIVTKLIKQNDFLLDELLRYKQEIGEFKQMFARLKRCKSQKYIPDFQENISIVDQQNINHSNLIQSKLVKDSTLQTSKVNDMQSLKGVKTDMQGQKLHQPKKHMKPSKRALQREIQQQNQKLYTLIQKFGQERDVEKRKRSRLEMSNCAQKLNTLRSHYKRHFCQYKNN